MIDEQIYNPVSVINSMLTDIKGMINPFIFKLHPVFSIMSSINDWLVVVVFLALLFYMLFVRRHHIKRKLKRRSNYITAGILLVIYAILTEMPMKIGPEFELNFGLIVMPLAAKLFGPVLAAAFGIIQYATSFIMHPGEVFDFSAMLIAGISGMLYGWVIYKHRTRYIRCLKAKLMVNIISNIVLVPMVNDGVMTNQIADTITQSIIFNIFLAPVQALIIFAALIAMRKLRKEISQIPWGLGK